MSKTLRLAAVLSLGMATTSAAQGVEFVVSSGRVIPLGAQRRAMSSGSVTSAHLWYPLNQNVAITGSFGWARTRDVVTGGAPRLNVFSYDVGAEVRTATATWRSLSARAFAGAGAGGRTYDYRSLDVDATHNAAAYGSAGVEVGVRRIRLRVEARDYITRFKTLGSLDGGSARNEMAVLAGVRIAGR